MNEKELLFLSHLSYGMDGSAIERYLPFYQLGYAHRLKEWQRVLVWEVVERLVKRREKLHFKVIFQTNRDYHQDRVMAFFELAMTNYKESPGWICHTFNRAFPQIEALLQLRRMGVALDSPSIMEFRKSYVTFFVEYFSYRRSKMNWFDWYKRCKGRDATHKVYCGWWKKHDYLTLVLELAPVMTAPFDDSRVDDYGINSFFEN